MGQGPVSIMLKVENKSTYRGFACFSVSIIVKKVTGGTDVNPH